jgi:hypothetical protein
MGRGLVADNGWGASEGVVLLAGAVSKVLRGKDFTPQGVRLQAWDDAFSLCYQLICQLFAPILPVSLIQIVGR